MTYNEPAQTPGRRKPSTIVVIMTAVLALATVLLVLMVGAILGARDFHPVSNYLESPAARFAKPHGKQSGGLGVAGGDVPKGTTVASDIPAVVNLDPALRAALGRASKDAAREGIKFHVNSGWRSPDFQHNLLQQAVTTYGSKEEASRWVATAETSAHVSGDAVDIGLWDASAWLSKNGAKYGLCQIYDNEAWHFELRSEAIKNGCPAKYFDPTYDPRMKR
ncbi:M15 family metallopeptidase [Paeniglutamicibacter sp. NPDC091659]|uniref:M15 family metallopeptidase n=1 Tax=Paeniglutamicibacter sp. NPDC091659 TaxID=3364389 RepID=UPI0037FA5167